MVFGVSTACMYPKELECVVEQYGKSGIRDIEIFVNTFSELSPQFVRILEERLKEGGIRVHAFHPFLSGLEPMMLFSGYDRRLGDMLDHYRRYFEIMQRFGAKVFVFHGDSRTSKHTPALYAQRYFALREAALPYGVTVAQENISRCKSGDLSFLKAVSDELGNDISFVFDLKQALRSGYSPEDVLRVMGKRVVHVHANDHTAEQDCLLPGKGDYDFAGLYRYFKENGMEPTTVVEVYRYNFGAEEELSAALGYLRSVCG